MFLYEFVIQYSSSTKRNIISAHLSFPRLKYDLNKKHTKAVSHARNTGLGVRKLGLQAGYCQQWGLKPLSLSEPRVSPWEVTQLPGYRHFCKYADPLSTEQSEGVISKDFETLCSFELLTLKTVRPQQKRKKILCLVPEICFAGGIVRMASWNQTRVSTPCSGGLEWPELTLLSFPNPTSPSSSFHLFRLLPPQLFWFLVPDSELQNNLARQTEGNFYTPSQVTDLLASPVCFHWRLFLHFHFLVKRTLWRKESEASNSSHFIF